ncbi:helix-turn-helix domain-containing protein [Streptomyces sp. NPDC050743]|uniref:helix-turn-helix domain-containing protein n=1 Tax=Streptomyces sp. NPDC050743 TaxID=3365634 RepID=UPI0037A8FCC2
MTSSSIPEAPMGSPERAVKRAGSHTASEAAQPLDTLGRALRRRRKSSGLSLRALAERVGISPSALSHIENGRSQPSVTTLFALVRELGTSLDELFAVGPAPARRERAPSVGTTVVQYADTRAAVGLQSGITWQPLASDEELQFIQLAYEPGAASCPDGSYVRHAGREYGLVLRGRLRITLGFEEFDLGPGDSIRFDAHLPHRLENVGDEPLEAVWVMVGRNGASPADAC